MLVNLKCPGRSSLRGQHTILYVTKKGGTNMWEGLVVKGASTTSHKCQHQREGRHRKFRRSEPRDDGDRYGLEGELEGVREDH
jgi:hypothetical protein